MFSFLKRLLQKHEKKVLAIVGVILMVVFVSSLAPSHNGTVGIDRTIGTIDGKAVKQSETAAAQREWDLLKKLDFHPTGDEERNTSFVSLLLQGAAPQIDSRPNTFYLLLREARDRNIAPDDEEVQSLLTNNIVPPPGFDDSDALTQAVTDFMMVFDSLEQTANMVKVTMPAQRYAMARNDQEMTLRVVMFPASSYLDKTVPSDAAIEKQFETFKSVLPGNVGSAGNPLGFGYETPDRVKVQYIGLKRDDIRKAAIASKSPTDWYVAAYTRFKNERDFYDGKEVKLPATPVTRRSADPTQPASTQATTGIHRLDDLDQDFALHADIVLDDLYDEQTRTMEGNVLKQIADGMSAGFGTWRAAQAASGISTTAPTTQTTIASGGPYANFQFLTDLAASVQKQTGILPTVGMTDQFRTPEELANIDSIGSAAMHTSNDQWFPFPQYATDLQSLLSPAMLNTPMGSMALSLLQPSQPVFGLDGSLYIFRVSAIDPAHSPTLADVKLNVIHDLQVQAGYDKATKAANALMSAAHQDDLEAAAAAAGHLTVISTDPFSPAQLARASDVKLPPLNVQPESARQLVNTAQSLVSTFPTPGGRPVGISELYGDATVAVVELASALPQWNPEAPGLAEGQVVREVTQQEKNSLVADLANPDQVALRLNYVPVKSASAQ